MNRVFSVMVGILVLGSLLLAACGQSKLQVGWVGTSTANQFSYRYETFTGTERKSIRLTAGETLPLTYAVEVDKGALTLAVQNPDGETLWEETFEEADGGETIELSAEQTGTYTLLVQGENTGGSFDVTWDSN
jgi:hypothetical protein